MQQDEEFQVGEDVHTQVPKIREKEKNVELQFLEKRVEEEMVNGLEEGLMRFCEHCGLGSCWKRGASINVPSISFSWGPQVHQQGRNTEKLVAYA